MKQRVTCNYAVLRFRPYQETGEFVNLGVVLFAHAAQYFDFRMETQRRRRVTDFFPELDVDRFRVARAAFQTEMLRVKRLLLEPQRTLDDQERLGVFRELVRPRESVFRFAEVSTVLAEDPASKLDELFQRYVNRQFAQTMEYQEVIMARRLGDILQANDLIKHFRRNATVGNDVFHTKFAFVSEHHNPAGAPLRAIKPLDLDRDEPTKIYDHGDAWIQRVKRLRQVGQAPEHLLFTIRLPKGDGKRVDAATAIQNELAAQEVAIATEENEQEVLDFARSVAV